MLLHCYISIILYGYIMILSCTQLCTRKYTYILNRMSNITQYVEELGVVPRPSTNATFLHSPTSQFWFKINPEWSRRLPGVSQSIGP